jgi:hypothetical protein
MVLTSILVATAEQEVKDAEQREVSRKKQAKLEKKKSKKDDSDDVWPYTRYFCSY